MFNVYVGYDTRLDEVYNVCRHSILRHSKEINVVPIVQSELRNMGVYYRDTDLLGSTEFTLTRFLVPYLNQYDGWSLFCDCDFLWTCDVNEVFDLRDDNYDVMVVKHDYTPKTDIKMDGKIQHKLPRKNWSSLMLFNNKRCTNLNSELINNVDPSYLHQFKWTIDIKIGDLPVKYNYLVGYYTGEYKALHYTDGGPWFVEYKDIEFSDLWRREYELYRERL